MRDLNTLSRPRLVPVRHPWHSLRARYRVALRQHLTPGRDYHPAEGALQRADDELARGRVGEFYRYLGLVQGVLLTLGTYSLESLRLHAEAVQRATDPVGWR